MTDKGFCMIIEALINHRDTIRSLEYNKNQLGPLSINAFIDLVHNLDELVIKDCTNRIDIKDSMNMLQSVSEYARKLQFLTLSKIDLGATKNVEKLCSLIQNRQFLTKLDISWANLLPL